MNSSTNSNNNNSNPNTNGNNISLLTKQQQHYIFMQQQQQQSNRRRSSVFANGNSNLNARHQSIVIPPTRIAGPNLQHHIDSNNNNNNDFAFLNSNNSFVNLNGNDFSFPIHQHQNDYNMNMLYNNSNNYFAFNNNNQHLPFTSNNNNNSSNGSISNLNFAASAGRKFSLQYVPKTAPNMSFCSSNENVNNQNDNQQKNKQFHFQQQNSFMGPPLLKSQQQQQQQQSFMMPQQELKHKNNALFNSYRRSSIQPFMQMNPNQSFRNVNFDQPLNSATSSTTTTSKPESLLSPIDVNMFVKKDEEENSIQWNLKYTGISPVKSHSEDDDDLPDPIQQSKIHSNRNINLKLKKFKRFDDFNFQEQQQQQIQSQNQINRFSPLSNLDPLASKTTFVTTTFKNNNENFQYETQASNPRRLLTKPNIPNIDINPYNCDNEVGDHIIHVGDVIGVYDPHMENLTRYKSTPSMTSRNGFKIMDLLGKGTFGQVIKCENLADGSIVAIKMIKASEECMVPSFMECKVLQRLQKQQRLLGRNNNINERNDNQDDHFINFLEEFVYKGHLCIVFELLGPSVLEVLQSNKFHGLHWDLITSFSKQLFHSLENLKMANVIHCDLKPENILLKNNGNPANGNSLKIIDFGASCFENQTVYSYIQSRFYRAPEVVLGLPYTSGIDMWSVGCVIAELYLGIPLFPGQSEYDLMVRIIESKVNVDAIPPKWMLDRSKFSTLFFHYDPEEQKYTRLKSIDEYNIDLKEWKATNNEIIIHHLGYPRDVEKPGKKYFENSDNFCKLILLHRFHKLAHLTDIEKLDVLKKRWIFHKFLQKCLDIDPFKRYTPTEALRDPFITGKWINNYDFEADVDFKDFLTVEKQNIFGKTSLSPSKSNSEKKKDTSPKSQSHDHCTKLENLQL
ncbi:hypothetical protein ACO0SA_001256 [Hanseniaspora valbyensis]